MHVNVIEPGGTVVPTLRYRDVAAAIDWLCNAFGFEKHLVVSGDSGAVRYAELTFGIDFAPFGAWLEVTGMTPRPITSYIEIGCTP